MTIPSNLVQTPSTTRLCLWVIPVAAGLPWLIGFISIFLIAPSNTGVSTWSAYSLFQTGSNFGNFLALALWSCAALTSGWLCTRGSAWISVRALCAYGVTAVLSLYPAAVVSNAVSHVVAIEDTFVYRDGLAEPLALSGLVALVAAFFLTILARRRGTQDSQSGA